MKWYSVMMIAVLAIGPAAFADEDDDMIMGNYRGEWTGAWAGKAFRAQVVAESKVAHRMVLFIEDANKGELRVEVRGRVEDGVAVFSDALHIETLGGDTFLEAKISGEMLTGVLKGKSKRRAEDMGFTAKRVFLAPSTLGMAPPEGAIMLFDGTHLDLWERTPLVWCLVGDGAMEVCSSSLKTKEEFGSGRYHVEFRTPFMPNAKGQSRGNSGVDVLGRYEVQVLDSFGLEPKDNHCGGLYSKAVPIADAVLPPKQWQVYDITFHAPQFDAQGNKIKNAVIHVVHNDIVIHDNAELDDMTPGGIAPTEGTSGPLLLQDHGDRVRYRNIWFQPMD